MRLTAPTALVGAITAAILAGCAAPTGDFGRPAPSYVNDTVYPAVGARLARLREDPVSSFAMTDAEEELRDRTYRFVMPIHRYGFLARSRTELVRTRLWSDEIYAVDPAAYYRHLRGERFRSEIGRYNAMIDEIRADTDLIGPYLAVVEQVYRADAARLMSLDRVRGLTAEEEDDAIARVYENRRVVTWAVAALRWRVASYAFALERSRIEIPSERAFDTELVLYDLQRRVDELAAEVARLSYDPAARPLVTKG
ncbi:hypothetical protein [Lutibaculum baratangense]|uniref:Lipoprotein n=1 Tax=Lutibaculum baratangense AMV1 TaxID=631454 RepID=V4T848_9HYPH|nr:hypothetical protein [Lutibaculum baratangense]ESR22773.1 hypothetical protein N177_3910 [Lutibaculum baratangense AMV1]